jgi:hypothetical protein
LVQPRLLYPKEGNLVKGFFFEERENISAAVSEDLKRDFRLFFRNIRKIDPGRILAAVFSPNMLASDYQPQGGTGRSGAFRV